MLTKENRESGKYGIYELQNPKFKNIDFNSYTKICVIRNPYERLISGIRQRSNFFVNKFKKMGVSKNTITEFLQKLKTHDYIEHHFYPQTMNVNNFNFKFDMILSIDQMSKLYELLGVEYLGEKVGNHITKYIDNDNLNYYNITIQDISNEEEEVWSSNINSWFTQDNIQLINELYKDDFEWLSNHGFDYKIN